MNIYFRMLIHLLEFCFQPQFFKRRNGVGYCQLIHVRECGQSTGSFARGLDLHPTRVRPRDKAQIEQQYGRSISSGNTTQLCGVYTIVVVHNTETSGFNSTLILVHLFDTLLFMLFLLSNTRPYKYGVLFSHFIKVADKKNLI